MWSLLHYLFIGASIGTALIGGIDPVAVSMCTGPTAIARCNNQCPNAPNDVPMIQ
jgi:hypothetical protein